MPGVGTATHNGKSEPHLLTNSYFDNSNYSAVILAGGDGARLSSFTHEVYGYHLPKQFCPLFEGETLLEQTMRRVSILVPPAQTLTVLNRAHRKFYSPILNGTAASNLLIQPENRGTAPAILCALLRLVEDWPHGPGGDLPFRPLRQRRCRLHAPCRDRIRAVNRSPQLTVLLGIAPEGPETEYGWIEPGSPLPLPDVGIGKVSRIRRFLEKPSPEVARELYDRNYLWNSFVLIANPTTLLSLIARAIPELYEVFSGIRPFFGGAAENEILQTIYPQISSADFSARVLANFPTEFSVLPVNGVKWSDLGDRKRMIAAISNRGRHVLGGNQNVTRSQSFAVAGSQEQTGSSKAFQSHR